MLQNIIQSWMINACFLLSASYLASPWHFGSHGKKLRGIICGYICGYMGDTSLVWEEMVPALSAEEALSSLAHLVVALHHLQQDTVRKARTGKSSL